MEANINRNLDGVCFKVERGGNGKVSVFLI